MDRDNTLVVDRGYTYKIEDFSWVTGATAALRRFHRAGIPVFVATNQGGVALGRFSLNELERFHAHLLAEAESEGGPITDLAACIHHPNAAGAHPCACRKPEPGLLLDLAGKWDIDLGASVMVGDRASDVEAGIRAGCHAYLFEGGDLDLLAARIDRTHFGTASR